MQSLPTQGNHHISGCNLTLLSQFWHRHFLDTENQVIDLLTVTTTFGLDHGKYKQSKCDEHQELPIYTYIMVQIQTGNKELGSQSVRFVS